MTLTDVDVAHVAALARLGLAPDERERLRDQLSSILGHIEVLNRLDTSAIPPTAQVLPLTNVLRDDEPRPSLPQAVALANAPRQASGFFEVHAVLTGADAAEETTP
jgi:aspartyl-tRNA(Asn)/glutamyl-tRNA(Gln) amidotransferase subunit C